MALFHHLLQTITHAEYNQKDKEADTALLKARELQAQLQEKLKSLRIGEVEIPVAEAAKRAAAESRARPLAEEREVVRLKPAVALSEAEPREADLEETKKVFNEVVSRRKSRMLSMHFSFLFLFFFCVVSWH
jgi:hypothetical protein